MQLNVEIGATIERWEFGPDDEFDRWLLRCPWQSGEVSQARTLLLTSSDETDVVAHEIRRMIYAADEGVYTPQVLFQPQADAASVTAMVSSCLFGEPRDLSALQLRRLVSDRLARAPYVFILSGTRNAREQMQEFIEALNREGTPYPLLLLYRRSGQHGIAEPDDFSLIPATFAGTVLHAQDADTHSLWHRYLHSRASWESSGDLGVAEKLGIEWSLLPVFDDEAIERSCQRVGKSRLQCVVTEELREYETAAKIWFSDEPNHLIRLQHLMWQGLAWQARHHPRPMPATWVVRGLRPSGTSVEPIERAAMVNAPLVAELLSWTFILEAQERARNPHGSEDCYTEEAGSQFTAFKGRKPWSAAGLYPRDYQFSASLSWFESFGTHCMNNQTKRGNERRSRLLSLRNGLCHGHFAAWSAIETISGLKQQ